MIHRALRLQTLRPSDPAPTNASQRRRQGVA